MGQRVRLIEDQRKEDKQRRHQVLVKAVHGGPPTEYRPEFAELARACALAFGCTNKELANFFSVNETTVDKWIAVHPEFKAALAEGKAQSDSRVVASLFRRAMGFSQVVQEVHKAADGSLRVIEIEKYFPPDTTACIYWTKNRLPADWRDRPEVQVNIAAGIKIESLSDSQLEHLISRLQEGIDAGG